MSPKGRAAGGRGGDHKMLRRGREKGVDTQISNRRGFKQENNISMFNKVWVYETSSFPNWMISSSHLQMDQNTGMSLDQHVEGYSWPLTSKRHPPFLRKEIIRFCHRPLYHLYLLTYSSPEPDVTAGQGIRASFLIRNKQPCPLYMMQEESQSCLRQAIKSC